jgi:acyl-CoA synthetase (NDP forming)
MATCESALARVLEPKAIAVVGASANELKVGGRVLKSIRRGGFAGPVYGVNPSSNEIQGYPCFPSLEQLPGPVDLVVIALPPKATLSVIEQAKAIGAGGAFLCAGGFAELSESGGAMQREISLAATTDFRLLGPNTQGFVNTTIDLSVNFSHRFVAHAPDPITGDVPVAVVSQGGGAGSVLYEVAHEAGLEISHYIPTGNESDLELAEVTEFLIAECGVKHVMVMAEMLRNPDRLRSAARLAASMGAGISLYVTAKRPLGALAAASHTASLGTQAAALEAFAEQAGIVSVDSVSELVAAATLQIRAPRPRGPRLGVLTNSGSAAVMISDACDEFGLEVPPLSEDGSARATAVAARGHIELHNPLDVSVTDRPSKLHPLMVQLTQLERFDALAIAVANQYSGAGADITEITDMMAAVSRESGVPVLPMWLSGEKAGLEQLQNARLPVFRDVRQAVLALSQVWKANRLSLLEEGPDDLTSVASNGAGTLTRADLADENVAKSTLARFSMSVPQALEVTCAEEAVAAAQKLGPTPVVLKAVRPGLLHKTELGLVQVGVESADAAATFTTMAEAAARADLADPGDAFTFIVEEMLQDTVVEMLLSVRQEPSVGWTLTVGWGGSHVELYDDIACVSLPAGRAVMADRLASLKCFPMLQGYRGKPGGSVEAVLDAMQHAAALTDLLPSDVLGLEINPLLVRAGDAVVLDVAIETHGEPA